jgi:outer membrane receptor protein involved in Fe transport
VSSGTLRGEGHFENVPRTRRRGVEAAIAYEGDRLSAFGAYTLQRATVEADLRIASPFHPDASGGEIVVSSGSRLPGVPAHLAKAGVSAAVVDALRVGIDLRAQSGQVLRGDESNRLPPVPAFAVVDARAEYRFTSRAALAVHVHNVFDRQFYTFGALGDAEEVLGEGFDDPRFYSPGAPRAAWIGVEVRF